MERGMTGVLAGRSRRASRRKSRLILVGALAIAVLFGISTISTPLAAARSPGSCYCEDYVLPVPFINPIDFAQQITQSGSGSNYYQTGPFLDTNSYGWYTGTMGVDQASVTSGGTYKWATSLGLQNGQSSAFEGSSFISGDPVTFYWDWYIKWAFVPQLVTSSACTFGYGYGGSLAFAANVHDVTTNSEVLSNAYTYTIDTESNNPYGNGNAFSYTVSFQTGPLNANNWYEMQGWIISYTYTYLSGCGSVQVNYNYADSGGYATLSQFGAYSS